MGPGRLQGLASFDSFHQFTTLNNHSIIVFRKSNRLKVKGIQESYVGANSCNDSLYKLWFYVLIRVMTASTSCGFYPN